MAARQEYHIAVKFDADQPRISVLLSRSNRASLPTSQLEFRPSPSDTVYPVTIYWRNERPADAAQQHSIEKAVLAYCARLAQETAYEGPLDCCL